MPDAALVDSINCAIAGASLRPKSKSPGSKLLNDQKTALRPARSASVATARATNVDRDVGDGLPKRNTMLSLIFILPSQPFSQRRASAGGCFPQRRRRTAAQSARVDA